MSKRLIRIKPEEVAGRQSILQKHLLNAVLFNGNTVLGRLISVDAAQLVLQDTRDHKHRIALSDLYEVVYDDDNGTVPPSRHATL